MNNRGQAAMEFLMTYGWAILAAVIVIGALAASGVFNPGKYIPTSCIMQTPFGCVDNQVAANTSAVFLVLRNAGGSSTDVLSVAVSNCGTYSTPITMVDQNVSLFTINCGSSIGAVGEKFSGDVMITHTPTSGGLLNLTSSGSVTIQIA